LTVLGMKHEDERVALQAVEFWSTVCDEEIELAALAEDAAEFDEPIDRESQHFARIALPEILPVLLQLLTKQEDDAADHEWNTSMAAGTCLALLAQAVGDGIVTPIIPFVEAHIRSTDWHHREAAVMAFGSIIAGPEPTLLRPLVTQALPTLIDMMRDPDGHVRDTTAWTLGRICESLVHTIDPAAHLSELTSALVLGLADSPRIASSCCWGLMNLAEQLGDPDSPASSLSTYYEGVSAALLACTEK
jgi:importin subunit beta-1